MLGISFYILLAVSVKLNKELMFYRIMLIFYYLFFIFPHHQKHILVRLPRLRLRRLHNNQAENEQKNNSLDATADEEGRRKLLRRFIPLQWINSNQL